MSGGEVPMILGVISSAITVVDATQKIYDAASDARGLPEAFRDVATRLPTVHNTLSSAKQHIENGPVSKDSCKGAEDIASSCSEKLQRLEKIFKKVMPREGASRMDRYVAASKTLGKGSRVETLMRGILEDLELLAIDHGMTSGSAAMRSELAAAIEEMAALPPSIPEQKEAGFSATSSGSGAINQAYGNQYFNSGSGDSYHARSMNFGSRVNPEQACLKALFASLRTDPRDDRTKLVDRKGKRTEGTCTWITRHVLYQSWLQLRSQLLWLSGGPGKGKTMLSIFLTEELERIAKGSQDAIVLYFFCDNKEQTRNTASSIVRGLMFQLLDLRQQLFHHILQSFEIQGERLFTGSSFESLWRIFQESICDPLAGTIYCVIDGLDECDDQSLEVLLARFNGLFSSNSAGFLSCYFNLIVVGRESPDFIAESLSEFPRIRLDPDSDVEVNRDIQRFISVQVDGLAAKKNYPEPLTKRVKQVFHERAQGTFLWVAAVATMLRKYKATEVEKALELFPPGLDEIYARILLQIDHRYRKTAAKILLWVIMAIRPLTLSELSTAVELNIEPSDIFTKHELIIDKVKQCGYLLAIEKCKVCAKGSEHGHEAFCIKCTTRLMHQSVKDYLLREDHEPNPNPNFLRIQKETANHEIAQRCLDYLHEGALAKGPVDLARASPHLEEYPLLEYAALSWPEHAKSLSHSASIFDLSRPFYQKESKIRASWVNTCARSHRYNYCLREPFGLLHLASWIGLRPLAERILMNYRRSLAKKIFPLVNSRDSLASWIGLRPLAERILLKYRKSLAKKVFPLVNSRDRKRQTPLHVAARSGHFNLVQLLLENGADINAMDSEACMALNRAAENRNAAIAQLLLNNNANVNALHRHSLSPLISAVIGGNEALVSNFIERGARLNPYSPPYPLWFHNIAWIQLLIDRGINIEVNESFLSFALFGAIEAEQENLVKLLLEKGAKNNCEGGPLFTALHEAARNGYKEGVRLLLEKGVDVNATWAGETALHVAARRVHEEVVQLLLQYGADSKAMDLFGRTAQDMAALSFMEELHLIDRGQSEARSPEAIDYDNMRRMAQEYETLRWAHEILSKYDSVLRLLGHKGLFDAHQTSRILELHLTNVLCNPLFRRYEVRRSEQPFVSTQRQSCDSSQRRYLQRMSIC
ncbi:hypothetical protein ACLMJK_000090 [Lecanora helva]